MFKGSITALVTPFARSGAEIDEAALRSLVEEQIKGGTAGVVPTGTTGESTTLSHDEHHRVIEIVVEQVKGRIPVIAGTGSNSTVEAVSLSKFAASVGATAALQIAPYYNKPSQLGIFRHIKTVADKCGLPIVLYNHQGRTGVTIAPKTVKELSDVCNIVAIKDASGGIYYTSEVLDRTGGKVAVLCGNDAWTLPLMAIGGAGVISVVSGIAPKDMSALCNAALAGDFVKARKLHYKLLPLIHATELEVNPVPVKTALCMMGKIKGDLRLPLAPLAKENAAKLKAALKAYKLIK